MMTLKVQVRLLPQTSVAVQATTLVPSGKGEPLGSAQESGVPCDPPSRPRSAGLRSRGREGAVLCRARGMDDACGGRGRAPARSLAFFPDWETLPYDPISPHQDLVSERLATLYRMSRRECDVILVAGSTALGRLAPASYLAAHTFFLKQGTHLDVDALRAQLALAGYSNVTQVVSPGEFSVRGGLIDLFPMGSALPYRLDLFGDDIESVSAIDPVPSRGVKQAPFFVLMGVQMPATLVEIGFITNPADESALTAGARQDELRIGALRRVARQPRHFAVLVGVEPALEVGRAVRRRGGLARRRADPCGGRPGFQCG